MELSAEVLFTVDVLLFCMHAIGLRNKCDNYIIFTHFCNMIVTELKEWQCLQACSIA